MQRLSAEVYEIQDRKADDDAHGARSADEDEEPVDDDRDEEDVEN
jgi:hypothetical protein